MQSRLYAIRGRVQGVWYRATIQQLAQEAGVSGYIRNCSDGSVEAAVSCPNDDCFDQFERLLWEGSPLSVVDNVSYDIIEELFEGGFEQR
ncbi:acylphosphatase [Sulfurimonas sp. HSL-3221]|uniref:acylphosphatase n=1 Tax=Sulfurimonadaceae TaxID=2771471 RepID=UPI001E61D963|nr:acylphosphatase [Sulfurimonas sp. HSL-3221]UFS63363.1 acylphosphatase [Sulfurimonas sp. HSL-3221]